MVIGRASLAGLASTGGSHSRKIEDSIVTARTDVRPRPAGSGVVNRNAGEVEAVDRPQGADLLLDDHVRVEKANDLDDVDSE